jgi:hypothetical protein
MNPTFLQSAVRLPVGVQHMNKTAFAVLIGERPLPNVHLGILLGQFGGKVRKGFVGNVMPARSNPPKVPKEHALVGTDVQTVRVSMQSECEQQHQVFVVGPSATVYRRTVNARQTVHQLIPVARSLASHS